MVQLDTIQKAGKLNEVYSVDEKGNGGANHEYVVRTSLDGCIQDLAVIKFQNGGRYQDGSIHGVLDVDLLEIVRDRLKSFQSGEFSCFENLKALEHIESALFHLNKRVEDRLERNVLGQNIK